MEIITDSAEHHFLTVLEKCKVNPKGWVCLYFAMSRGLNHDTILKDLNKLESLLINAEQQGEKFFQLTRDHVKDIASGYAYRFSDGDIIVLVQGRNDQEKNQARHLYNTLSQKIESTFCDYSQLENDLYTYLKLADTKLVSEKRLQAYKAMTNRNKISSIPARRKRREDPLVMVVEDDRFTTAYATSILNKMFDVCHAKTGEEAIIQYIETAPDIVLQDIHLPGINGHQTLQAIQKIDPHAFTVMLSVDTSQENVVAATKSGAHTFLKKPFSRDRLIATVRKSPHIRMRDNFIQETVKV